MVFPRTVLGNKVELYYDGAWHNIVKDTPLGTDEPNSRVRGLGAQDGDITISARGQADESSGLQPTQAKFAVNNKDGKYSPRNASSDLYGKIGLNTPCRISTDLVDTLSIVDTFSGTRTNTWGTTDTSGHTWVNTTTGSANDFDVTGGVGIHSHSANTTPHYSSINSTVGGETLTITDFDVTVSGIVASVAAAGDNIEVGLRLRADETDFNFLEARLLFNPSNIIYIAVREIQSGSDTVNSGFVQVPGLLSTDTLDIRAQVQGRKFRMKCWETGSAEPAAWFHEIDVTYLVPGRFRYFTTLHAGNANAKPVTVSVSSIDASLGIVLFTGEVAEWPKRWDKTGSDVWVPITASGITRRKRQGNRPTRSPLYNYIRKELGEGFLGINYTIQHYWPLENLSQQTRRIRSDMDGSTVLDFDVATHNTVEWSSNDFVVGSHKLGTITGLPIPEGVVSVPFISSFDAPPLGEGYFPTPDNVADPDAWAFMCYFYFPPLLPAFPFVPATSLYFTFAVPDSTIGNIFVDVQYRPADTGIELDIQLSSTSGDLASSGSLAYEDKPRLLVITNTIDGSDTWETRVYIDGEVWALDTASFRPFAHCRRFDIETEPYSPITIGHLALETSETSSLLLDIFQSDIMNAGLGHPGETAVERFERVNTAESLEYEVIEGALDADYPTELGPQAPGNFIDYMNDIRLADDGVVYELRTPAGYGFKTRQSLYDPTPKLELDYTATDLGEVPFVTDDDQLTRNIVRIKRRGGTQGEVTSIITDGPLGTDIAGDYEEGTIEAPLHTEEGLADYAAFRTFRGTWDEDRWPSLTVYLHRTPFANNHTQWVKAAILEIGDLVSVANTPAWLGDDEDVLLQMRAVEGIRLSNFEFDITWSFIPGGPWAALNVLNDPDESRVDTTECSLEDAINSSDTDFIVNTDLTEDRYDTPLWTRNPGSLSEMGSSGIHFRVNPATRLKARGGEKVTAGALADTRDTFTRSGSQLSGTTADTGETWAMTTGTATNISLNGSSAVALHSSANTDYWAELPLGDTHWDHAVSVDVTLNFTTATGAQYSFDVVLRQASSTNNYIIRGVLAASSSSLVMQVRKTVGGVSSQIGQDYAIGTNASGTAIHVRAAIFGRNLYAKMWIGSATEPVWQHMGFNSAPVTEAINGTSIGLRSTRATGNTNTNPTTTFDNLRVWQRKIQPVRWDRFARTVTNDPGNSFPDDPTAQFSYTWFTAGAGTANDIDFAPNACTMTLPGANGYNAIYDGSLDFNNAVASVVWTCPLATGASLEPGCIMMRGVSNVSYVLFRAVVTTSNTITMEINSAAGASLGTQTLWGVTHAAATPMVTKAGCFGDYLYMKIWRASEPEPPYWQLRVVDPFPTVSGWVGLRAGRAASNTNVNPQLVFHDFMVENPQRITADRGVNGVTRSHEAGDDFRLWSPFRFGR